MVTATNRDLKQLVKEGKFREDLYYRIQGFLIHMPPLRERGNDVIILTRHFLDSFCRLNKMDLREFSKAAYQKILEHNWPGNIRELKSFVERAVLISDSNLISEKDLIFT